MSGDAPEPVRHPDRAVIELESGILVYPPEAEGEPWRATFTENGRRKFRQGTTEAKLAAKLEKVKEPSPRGRWSRCPENLAAGCGSPAGRGSLPLCGRGLRASRGVRASRGGAGRAGKMRRAARDAGAFWDASPSKSLAPGPRP